MRSVELFVVYYILNLRKGNKIAPFLRVIFCELFGIFVRYREIFVHYGQEIKCSLTNFIVIIVSYVQEIKLRQQFLG